MRREFEDKLSSLEGVLKADSQSGKGPAEGRKLEGKKRRERT